MKLQASILLRCRHLFCKSQSGYVHWLFGCAPVQYLPVNSQRKCFYSVHPEQTHFNSEEDALRFIYLLQRSDRKLLHKALSEFAEQPLPTASTTGAEDGAIEIHGDQLKALFLFNTLPFIGFGILDNLLMIIAGEYIDATLGVALGISTMAAAGLGNILSDIAGVGSAHYVEYLVGKLGIKVPALTVQQWSTSTARWTSNLGRAVGLTLGCLIGMFPLLFFNEAETRERKILAQQQNVKSTQSS